MGARSRGGEVQGQGKDGEVYASDDNVTIVHRRRYGGEDEERGGEGQGQGQDKDKDKDKDKDRGVRMNSEAHSGDGNSNGNMIRSKVRWAGEQGDLNADKGRGPW